MNTDVRSPGVKEMEHEVDYSAQFGADVKNKCSYTLSSPMCLYGTDRENFFFIYNKINI
jgi:hypothetical protein